MKKISAAVFIVSLLAGAACKRPAPVFKAVAVKETSLEVMVAASGKVEPEKLVEIRSKAGGELIDIPFKVGDEVKAGQVIIRMDPRTEQSRLKEAQSRILSSHAEMDRGRISCKQALREYSRLEQLLKEGAIESAQVDESRDRLEMAEADLEIAQAGQAAAEAGLRDARIRLEDTLIRAPISGVILSRSVEVGQVISSAVTGVNQGTLLLTMADLKQVQVRANVDETDVPKLAPGQDARVKLEAYPGKIFAGKVENIWPQAVASGSVSFFPVEIEISGPDKNLMRPGMRAEVEIIIEKIDRCLAVPVESVLEREGKFGVYVLAGSRPGWREIEVGESAPEMVEVKKGLKPGEMVVTRGFEQISQ